MAKVPCMTSHLWLLRLLRWILGSLLLLLTMFCCILVMALLGLRGAMRWFYLTGDELSSFRLILVGSFGRNTIRTISDLET